jgi:hypothetical protein
MENETINTLFGTITIQKEEKEQKQNFTPFDFIKDINYEKQYLYSETTKSEYNPWLTNISMSMFTDTLLHAAFLNSNAWLDKKIQHDYLYHVVPKRKRFKKDGWFKKNTEELQFMEDAAAIFNYSIPKMKLAWSMLTKPQKASLKNRVYPDIKNKKK